MPARTTANVHLDPRARAFYVHTLETLNASGVPYLVGGAYAFARYTGIERHTKDLDLFVRPEDARRALTVLAEAGYQTDMTFPHWLGKAFHGEAFIDVIFSAGNNVARVDDRWFEHASRDEVLGVQVLLIPPEEMVWSKGYIMERERFDAHWQVLLAHLVLFDFVYPGERRRIPAWVTARLTAKLAARLTAEDEPDSRVCQGTLLSRQQYLTDIGNWRYDDARLVQGHMAPEDIAHWTAAIAAAH